MSCPTLHNEAQKGDFAKTVLMPGDPLRSEFIAKNFLENAKLVNNVRGIQGYTGTYKGKEVSVMASGMGMPSMGIYSYELFNFYDVDNIIRIGSCGSIKEDVKIYDIVYAIGASTDSNYFDHFELPGTYSATASYYILEQAKKTADNKNVPVHIGNILTSNYFYDDNPNSYKKWQKLGVLGIDMETAALYAIAARANKNALAMFTVSNSIISNETISAKEARTSFTTMMELALETSINL